MCVHVCVHMIIQIHDKGGEGLEREPGQGQAGPNPTEVPFQRCREKKVDRYLACPLRVMEYRMQLLVGSS